MENSGLNQESYWGGETSVQWELLINPLNHVQDTLATPAPGGGGLTGETGAMLLYPLSVQQENSREKFLEKNFPFLVPHEGGFSAYVSPFTFPRECLSPVFILGHSRSCPPLSSQLWPGHGQVDSRTRPEGHPYAVKLLIQRFVNKIGKYSAFFQAL